MSAALLDVNVLIALAWPQHVHHAAAHRWFAARGRGAWATCALTQLAFVRISSNPKIIDAAVAPTAANAALVQIASLSGHQYWENLPPPAGAAALSSVAVAGHRQVTDAYLIALAVHHRGRLVTFDKAVPALAAALGNEPASRVLLLA